MTKEDIIAMARKAGLMSFKYPALIAEPDWEATERFAALIAAAAKAEEREACAKVCELNQWSAAGCAYHIRARGETQ